MSTNVFNFGSVNGVDFDHQSWILTDLTIFSFLILKSLIFDNIDHWNRNFSYFLYSRLIRLICLFFIFLLAYASIKLLMPMYISVQVSRTDISYSKQLLFLCSICAVRRFRILPVTETVPIVDWRFKCLDGVTDTKKKTTTLSFFFLIALMMTIKKNRKKIHILYCLNKEMDR